MESNVQTEWQRNLAEANKQMEGKALQAIQRIEELAQTVDPIKLFVAVVANLSIAPAELISETTHGSVPSKIELLAFYLYPFGELSKAEDITPWDTKECLDALESLHMTRLIIGPLSETRRDDPVSRIKDFLHRQARIVRGSAYPEQTSDEIISVQGKFENWFAKRVGVGPIRVQSILCSILGALERAATGFMPDVHKYAQAAEINWRTAKKKFSGERSDSEQALLGILENAENARAFGYVARLNAIVPQVLPVAPTDLIDIPTPTDQEWEALINLIGFTSSFRSPMTDTVEVRQRPLFVLPDNRVILVDLPNALDVVWDKYEQIAKSNEKFFQKSYQRKKSKWLEEKVADTLAVIFPAKSVFRDLTYPDPDKSDRAATQLDAAVRWGPFLILVEAKAKQFRMESQLGDVGRLYSDIKDNINDAFDQARRAVRHINQATTPEFTEGSTGRKLTFSKRSIQRIYLLTVSQHNLAGLATQLATLQNIGLFRDEEYPLSISIADLETIAEFCDGPDLFLHYVERRLDIQRNAKQVLADELDLFGAYLDTRLQASRIWDRGRKAYNSVWLSGFSEQFDAWMMYKRGELSTPPSIKLNAPNEIQDILCELRKRNDDDAKWIAFALLDMPDDILGAIAQGFRDIKEATLTPGMFRRMVYPSGDTVISIVASIDQTPSSLHQRTQMRTILEKYRHKARRSVGFGIMVLNKTRPFEFATWLEGPWKYDERIANALEDEPPYIPAPGQKLPGRNDPCICESGKKFKKCCEPKIKAARLGKLEDF